ncbi:MULTISPECIES: flagellar hook-length control protein FliK [unclassified Oceanispirochaeta]|uniref:flagellar hook-length control protein FliK n=1 Tax=unclassified Oceanispirochaeta TaxID=2635722 RepID=UPI000E0953F2|nr:MULTISPECIES: flagellar hook-length control protein FliK [unclassified Oceanispirochaeta]MBF9018574.1 flagellar hook-length control protein FliK [Oceanispirochaeta sp. M2]NPD75019.1 flagellar hook-length control protein FliK [Oceanispirochaeta sp. M1]RDG29140.1 flagellar hook-length control protein FliK [Oceanispirochaeta sp. M1]
MKIDSSSGKAEISALTDRQNLKASVSGKAGINSAAETAVFKESELLSRSIESLLKMLKPSDTIHEVLRSLLKMIPRLPAGGEGLPANTDDSRLLFKVLVEFRESRGNLLPERIMQELKFTEKLLEKNQLKESETLILFHEEKTLGRPALRVDENKCDPPGEEDQKQLSLQIDLENLGSVSILLRRKGEKLSCLIQTTSKESRNKIRKAHSVLLEQVKERGLRLDDLSIRSRVASSEDKNINYNPDQEKKGLDLWG